ncbi:odorant receptor 131-2-like [Cololabis saira]|uniref:odorant receptor 131-2-like n=1 Tax=Cololabis saira TaxID=129043 RepID=UPI002AD3C742|nr:odorant receptor 131-2-like [Cololabis saira]
MVNASSNSTVNLQRQTILGIVFVSIVTTLPCCVFLFINGTMLFTLRSKTVFQETPCYILVYNLLFADTIQMAQGQSMFLVSACRLILLYPVCAVLVVINAFTKDVSVLTLVLMCLERYVAVCYPLRHAAVITVRNTGVAIGVIWTFSLVNALIKLSLMLNFPLEELKQMQMKDFCGKDSLFIDPLSALYHKTSTYFIFVLACVSVGFSYIGVMVAARLASTDKASAKKARNTLLLYLVQLGLSMSSLVYAPLLVAISKLLDRLTTVYIQICIYILVLIFPKCLSSLIYSLRDNTIRPVLMFNLGCRCF